MDTPRRPSKENGDDNDATAVPSPNQQQKSKRRRRKNKKKGKKVLSTGAESNVNTKMAAVSTPSRLALKDRNANLGKDDQSKTAVDKTVTKETAKPSTSPSAIIPTLRQDLYIHPTTEKYLSTIKHRPASDANHNLPSLDRLVEQASRIECELIDEIRSIQSTLGVNEGQMASPIRSKNGSTGPADLPSSFECDRDSASLVSEIPFDLQSTPARVLTTVTGRIINMSPEDKGVENMLVDAERIVSELHFSPVAVNDSSKQRKGRNVDVRMSTNHKIAATLCLSVAIFSILVARLSKKATIVDAPGPERAGVEDAEAGPKIIASMDRASYFIQRKGFDSSIRDKTAQAASSDNAMVDASVESESEKYQADTHHQDELEQEEIAGGSFISWPIGKRGLDFLEKPSNIDIHRKGLDFLHEDESIEAPNDMVQWIVARQSGSACFQPVGVLSSNFEVAHRGSGCSVDLEDVLREYHYDSGVEIEAEVENSSDASKGISYQGPYRPGIGLRPSFLPSEHFVRFAKDAPNEPSPGTTFNQQRKLWDAHIYAKAEASLSPNIARERTTRMLRSLAATHVREQLSYLAKQPKWAKIELAVPKLALLEAEE